MFEGLPHLLIAGTVISAGTVLYHEFRKVKERVRDLTITKDHLHRMVDLRQMHNDELKAYANKRDEEYLLNLYRCYCGDMLREKALFCHKCGRRKGT